MKRLYTHLLLALVACLFSLSAAAQGKSYVGYSDGAIATSSVGKYTALGDANSTVSVAICLPKATLAAYVGCKVVGVNYGFPTSQGLPKLTAWVRSTLTGENITDGVTYSTSYGWKEVSVEPYTITGEERELWIGATYKNDSKKYIAVSFAGTPTAAGCYVNAGSGWTNYASQGWGSLSLEAIIEGANVPTRNLSLVDVATRQRSVQVGEPISLTGTIKNNASMTATRPVIKYSINGKAIGSYTYDGSIEFRKSAAFALDIPTTSFTEAITANVELSLEWADGVADDAPADNVANLAVELSKEVFVRRMVVEELTGAGCGYCPRGIVGLKTMKEKYPDKFIGIGVHSSGMGPDPYTHNDYVNLLTSYFKGMPNCIINRKGSEVNPQYDILYTHYQAMDAQADADIQVEASYSSDNKITFTAHSRFAFSEEDGDYRVAFVVLENQLPISQTNYYSGSSSSMGGFEKLPDPAPVLIDDVARGIFPSTVGTQGSIPASVTKGQTYDYTYTTTMPKYSKGENVEVVALLLNGRTGEILNAIKTEHIEGLSSGSPVDPPVNPIDPSQNLSHTLSPASGSTMDYMDKVIVTFSGKYAEDGLNTVGYWNWLAPTYGVESIPNAARPYLRDAKGNIYRTVRTMWTYNPDYKSIFDIDDYYAPRKAWPSDVPYNYDQFELDFDGVPAGQYTLVIPKNFFVYYDEEGYLCGTKEFTAEYTVTKSRPVTLGKYDAHCEPAEFSSLSKFEVITLVSKDEIYNYTNSDLGYYYNYFAVEEARRPYVILPSGAEIEAKYVDYVETVGFGAGTTRIQLTFSPSYAQGVYTVVFPDEFIVETDSSRAKDYWEARCAPERRFTFFVGEAPAGIDAPELDAAPASQNIYDLWGRTARQGGGIGIENGRKVIR